LQYSILRYWSALSAEALLYYYNAARIASSNDSSAYTLLLLRHLKPDDSLG
jgi:hypothetical protein